MKWETEIFQSDIAKIIKKEYKTLLSVGKSEEDAQQLVIEYCMKSLIANNTDMAKMWIALGYTQWQLGRLSNTAAERMKIYLKNADTWLSLNTIAYLNNMLQSSMPEKKKIAKPHVRHCPWQAGSLLAYRICSNHRLEDNRFWMKYVLLRVIRTVRIPITALAPEEYYNELMLVGLYKWVGDTIPNTTDLAQLEFTPIIVAKPMLSSSRIVSKISEIHSDDLSYLISEAMRAATTQRIETCCSLDWGRVRDSTGEFVLIDFDPSFETPSPEYFMTSITKYSLCNIISFDAVVVNRLNQLFEQ